MTKNLNPFQAFIDRKGDTEGSGSSSDYQLDAHSDESSQL